MNLPRDLQNIEMIFTYADSSIRNSILVCCALILFGILCLKNKFKNPSVAGRTQAIGAITLLFATVGLGLAVPDMYSSYIVLTREEMCLSRGQWFLHLPPSRLRYSETEAVLVKKPDTQIKSGKQNFRYPSDMIVLLKNGKKTYIEMSGLLEINQSTIFQILQNHGVVIREIP